VKNHYFDFNGRARRMAYWYFVLVYILVILAVSIVFTVIGLETVGSVVTILIWLALILPALGLGARRMHDIDKSGWWILINLVPLVGGIWFIILAATDSTPGNNRFGPNPKGE
jgi:uncharacterized membrane protein YhaH (DUF805 family)